MSALPLISVCVINYNGKEYVADTIESIIGQTYPALRSYSVTTLRLMTWFGFLSELFMKLVGI
jgi:GT2 family glycosyltransferase